MTINTWRHLAGLPNNNDVAGGGFKMYNTAHVIREQFINRRVCRYIYTPDVTAVE